jgi:hypothetical protein
MRNIVEVINNILYHTPSNETDFIRELCIYQEDALFRPPEDNNNHRVWKEVHVDLYAHIYPPTESWHWEVWSEFTGVSVETLTNVYYTLGG